MSAPGPYDGLPWVLMGALSITFRHAMARNFKAARDSYDRAYDEDGLAFWIAVIGGITLLMGVATFVLWATA